MILSKGIEGAAPSSVLRSCIESLLRCQSVRIESGWEALLMSRGTKNSSRPTCVLRNRGPAASKHLGASKVLTHTPIPRFQTTSPPRHQRAKSIWCTPQSTIAPGSSMRPTRSGLGIILPCSSAWVSLSISRSSCPTLRRSDFSK